MTKSIPIIGIVLLLIGACTSVSVKPLNPTLGVSHICIKDNPKVAVSDFVDVIRDGFDRHGIATQVFEGPIPSGCEYILTYTALRSWDFAPYLSHAELRIERNYRQVAFAEYHLNGKGGLSLMKWAGTQNKMDPVIDELLAQYNSDLSQASPN